LGKLPACRKPAQPEGQKEGDHKETPIEMLINQNIKVKIITVYYIVFI